MDKYDAADFAAMKEVERAIVQTVMPFRERMAPWLVALALLRCCRTVLRLCKKDDQKALVPTLVAYLKGDIKPPGEPSLLWTPGERMN